MRHFPLSGDSTAIGCWAVDAILPHCLALDIRTHHAGSPWEASEQTVVGPNPKRPLLDQEHDNPTSAAASPGLEGKPPYRPPGLLKDPAPL
jgi:hypothetical protein